MQIRSTMICGPETYMITVDSQYLKVKVHANYWHLKVNFLVPENFLSVVLDTFLKTIWVSISQFD